ncbi:uncharacterized protein LOC135500327 [Lineus longissimus]|uniref:uncharacterized protein LOC135500327 n=1 Tax=Lineus longissimus TaxID=88925 RepID=UPI00315C4C39
MKAKTTECLQPKSCEDLIWEDSLIAVFLKAPVLGHGLLCKKIVCCQTRACEGDAFENARQNVVWTAKNTRVKSTELLNMPRLRQNER